MIKIKKLVAKWHCVPGMIIDEHGDKKMGITLGQTSSFGWSCYWSHANGGRKGSHQNGQLRRLDGPAIEYIRGDVEWYQNGPNIIV